MKFTLIPGERVLLGSETFHLIQKISEEKWLLEHDLTGEYSICSEQQLLYRNCQLKMIAHVALFEDNKSQEDKIDRLAEIIFHDVFQSGEIAAKSLVRVEIDHSVLDLHLIGETTFRGHCRPTLVVCTLYYKR